MLILAEATPNPDALKFLPQMRLTDGRGWSFTRGGGSPATSPLALALFELPSVARVYVGEDFVTVTRAADGEAWATLRPEVLVVVAEVLGDGRPAVCAPEAMDDPGAGLEVEIRDVLARHVRPGVARDGGDVVFEHLDPATGVLLVRMEGACGGCPSSRRTLKDAVERIVRRYVPEVTAVEEAAPADPDRRPAWRRWIAERKAGATPARPVFRHNGRPFRS